MIEMCNDGNVQRKVNTLDGKLSLKETRKLVEVCST